MPIARRHKNRRHVRQHVLDVRVRTREVRSARLRLAVAACSLAVGAITVLFLLWRAGEWVLREAVFDNPAFTIRRLEVDTEGKLPPTMVRDWTGIRPGENLISLDLTQVKRDLELVSWIERVSLQRLPPETLRIRVIPRVPVAEIRVPYRRLQGGLGMASLYVDTNGYAMQLPRSNGVKLKSVLVPLRLPQLIGLTNAVVGRPIQAPNLKAALDLITLFGDSPMGGITQLNAINLARSDVLQVETIHQSKIILGLADLPQQLRRWRQVHDYASTQAQVISWLNLSVTNNVPAVLEDPGQALGVSEPTGPTTKTRRPHA